MVENLPTVSSPLQAGTQHWKKKQQQKHKKKKQKKKKTKKKKKKKNGDLTLIQRLYIESTLFQRRVPAEFGFCLQEKDIAAADLYIYAKRAEYVHYSQPFLNFGLRILIKKPPTWQDTEGFAFVFSPLKAEVWLIAVVAFIIVSVLLTLIAK